MNRRLVIRLACSLLFAVVLGGAAGYQVLGQSRDYENYFQFFDLVRSAPSYWDINYRFEPGFTALIYWLTKSGLDNYAIYSVAAGLIVFIKYQSISSIERYWSAIFCFTVYFLARYFVLFEMTVLRAAFAFSLAFFVFFRRGRGGVRLLDLVVLGLAVAFHYSAIVFFIAYLISPSSRLKVVGFAGLVFVVVVVFKKIALDYLPDYLYVFSTYREFGSATVLPIPMILDLLFLLFAIIYFDRGDYAMRCAVFGMALGFAFHFSLVEYSILAGRFRELLSMFYLIYIVRAIIGRDLKVAGVSMAYGLVTAIMYVYGEFFYDPLLS